MPELPSLFVGRTTELHQSLETVRTNVILNVHGPGGIGKSCFVSQLVSRVSRQPKVPITGPLDLGEMENQSRKGLLLEIVEQLGRAYFTNFLDALSSFADTDPYRRPGLWDRIFDEFLRCYRNCAKRTGMKRHVIVFDTFEVIQERAIGQWLLSEFIPSLGDRATFIVAGRTPIPDASSSVTVAPVGLTRLTDSECRQYVDARLSARGLEEMSDSAFSDVLRLSKGIPILLVLATDWYLEFGQHLSPEFTQDDFEYSAVAWIRDLKDPQESLVLLAMATFHVRFDPGLVSRLLEVDEETAQNVLLNLGRFAFTKADRLGNVFGLHDEMRSMIQTHVALPAEITKGLASQAAHHFESQLPLADPEHRDDVLAKVVYFKLLANLAEGREMFEKAFSQALHTNLIDHARLLLRTSEALLVTGFADGDMRTTLARAQIYAADWQPQQALILLEILEQIGSVESETGLTVLTLITKARALLQQAEPIQALNVLERGLEVSSKLSEKPHLAEVYSLLGSTCQAMGLYARALQHQEHALAVAQQEHDLAAVALILKNQSECYRRLGRASEALEYAEYGISLAREIGDEGVELQTFLQKAKVVRDERKFDESEELFLDLQRRLLISRRPKAWTASVYQEMAWLYLLKGELKKARSYAKDSLSLCDSLHYLPEKPAALHTLFHALVEEQGVESGEALIQQCYDLAIKVVDIFFVFNALEHMSEIAVAKGKHDLVFEYEGKMQFYQDQGYQFPLFVGRVKNILGDICFEESRLTDALAYYLDGYSLIARAGVTSSPKSIDGEFTRLGARFDMLPQAEADVWTHRFATEWQNRDLNAVYPRLISICRLARLKHRLDASQVGMC